MLVKGTGGSGAGFPRCSPGFPRAVVPHFCFKKENTFLGSLIVGCRAWCVRRSPGFPGVVLLVPHLSLVLLIPQLSLVLLKSQAMPGNTKQCQAKSSDAKQCKAMPRNRKQCHAVPRRAKKCQAMQNNAKQCKSMPNNVKQCKAMQSNAKQCEATTPSHTKQ